MAGPSDTEKPPIDLATAQFDEVTDDISDVKLIDIPVLIVFWILFFIVALQFFTRYVLNDSLAWTEEIARFFLIFLGFIGSITCIRKGSHIYLEFFYRYLPLSLIKPTAIFCEMAVAVFFSAAGYLCIGLAQRTFAQRMISVDLPKGIIYWVVVVACFAMALVSAWNVVRLVRRSSSDIVAQKLDISSTTGN